MNVVSYHLDSFRNKRSEQGFHSTRMDEFLRHHSPFPEGCGNFQLSGLIHRNQLDSVAIWMTHWCIVKSLRVICYI